MIRDAKTTPKEKRLRKKFIVIVASVFISLQILSFVLLPEKYPTKSVILNNLGQYNNESIFIEGEYQRHKRNWPMIKTMNTLYTAKNLEGRLNKGDIVAISGISHLSNGYINVKSWTYRSKSKMDFILICYALGAIPLLYFLWRDKKIFKNPPW